MTIAAISIAREIRAALSTGSVVRVKFLKVDGSDTERYLTRNQDFIPEDSRPKYVKAEDPHYVVAWDLDKKGWVRFHESKAIEWRNTAQLEWDDIILSTE